MMRLSPPGQAKLSQVSAVDITYGGGEANVSIALGYLGVEAAHVTRFPDNYVGRAATQYLRHHWVDSSFIQYGNGRLGKYFLEKGAVHRASEIVYDRENSAFALIQEDSINWQEVFKGASWFHWTGITPAISAGAAASLKIAIKTANDLGITISTDIHSRKNLWQYGKTPNEIMPPLTEGCTVIIGSARDICKLYGFEECSFEEAAAQLMKKYPRIEKVIDKTRESINASHNKVQAKMWNGKQLLESPIIDITHIVDRVGTGDAFAAGLIFGLRNYKTDLEALKFANAACALKHTIEGDANMVSKEMVESLMEGSTEGNIIR